MVLAGFGTVAPSPTMAQTLPTNPWLSRRVLDIAHAGGENKAPHSTLFAYERADAAGAEVLDGDLRLSADGVLVVHHDETVDTTTNGTGPVAEKTYAELFALDHGYRFTPYAADCSDCPEEDYIYRGVRTGDRPAPAGHEPDDFVIPRARDLFEKFPHRFLNLEVEGTGAPAQAAADKLVRLIHEFGRWTASWWPLSTTPSSTTSTPRTGHHRGARHEPGHAVVVERGPLPGFPVIEVPPTYSGITVVSPEMVADAHAGGIAVWVWMTDRSQESEAFYRSMIDMGVDGIIATTPALARGVIDEAGERWTPPSRRRLLPPWASMCGGPTPVSTPHWGGSTAATASASPATTTRTTRTTGCCWSRTTTGCTRRPASGRTPPRHGDRHLGAVGPPGAPRLRGQPRRAVPGDGPADERRYRHPPLGDEPVGHRDGALRADVGPARHRGSGPGLRTAQPQLRARQGRPPSCRSGQGHDDAITIHQCDAVLWGGRLLPGERVDVPAAEHVHMFVAVGGARLGEDLDLVRATPPASPVFRSWT